MQSAYFLLLPTHGAPLRGEEPLLDAFRVKRVVALQFDCHIEFGYLLEADRAFFLFHADGLIEKLFIFLLCKTCLELGSIVTI